jgi:hypothetical protein
MSLVQTSRPGSDLVTVYAAELVTIGIGRNATGRPTRIFARTGLRADPVIRWMRPEAVAPHPLPLEVLWSTVDLAKGERIRIEARPDQHGFFRWNAFELDQHHFAVATDRVVSFHPLLGHRQDWHYGIALESPRLPRPLVLDTFIVIEEFP